MPASSQPRPRLEPNSESFYRPPTLESLSAEMRATRDKADSAYARYAELDEDLSSERRILVKDRAELANLAGDVKDHIAGSDKHRSEMLNDVKCLRAEIAALNGWVKWAMGFSAAVGTFLAVGGLILHYASK